MVVELDPVAVREVKGMKTNDVLHAVRVVEEHREKMLSKWRELHGE